MNIKSAKNNLQRILKLKEHLPVLLWSSSGIGKSEICKQIAEEFGWKFIDIRLPLLLPSDLLGLPYPDKEHKRAKWLYPDFFPDPDSKEKTLILFDEIGNSPITVQSAVYRIILDRSVGEHYHFPKGVKMVAASNLITDQSGVNRLSKALANRFTHFFIEADFDAWKEWSLSHGVNEKIIAFLNFKSNLLSTSPKVEEQAFATPRSWMKVSNLLNSNIIDENIIAGTVGPGVAAEFFAYIEVYGRLPDINRILNGNKVDIPKEPSVLYAVSSSLSLRATEKNIENIFNFCKQLNEEFHILTIRDIARRDEKILQGYSRIDEWISKYDKYFDDDKKENIN